MSRISRRLIGSSFSCARGSSREARSVWSHSQVAKDDEKFGFRAILFLQRGIPLSQPDSYRQKNADAYGRPFLYTQKRRDQVSWA